MRIYDGDDPISFVVSMNLKRRHLSENQRAMVAAEIATLEHGQRESGQLAAVPTQAEAAEMLNVSERSVRRAAVVRDNKVPELVDAVKQGRVSVSAAADVASLPPLFKLTPLGVAQNKTSRLTRPSSNLLLR